LGFFLTQLTEVKAVKNMFPLFSSGFGLDYFMPVNFGPLSYKTVLLSGVFILMAVRG